MAAQFPDSAGAGLPRLLQPARPEAHPSPGYPLRNRLAVIASGFAEVVRFAGGWLFDEVMAGWDVTVLTRDHADPRPLQILGARDLETVLAGPVRGRYLQAVAVQADLFSSDVRVRRMAYQLLSERPARIRLWGDGWPEDLHGTAGPVSHRLSVAARAFKAQALAAAAAPAGASEDTEVFRMGRIRPPSPAPGQEGHAHLRGIITGGTHGVRA
jgi:hypothetical protein